ncbi:hypothetical protein [Aeromicrobium sp.]|uniref:hypothetical protein n=1 Tax=Aeromicrobium sp. TaxID=1871063 RepID=UPI002FC5FE38
MTDPILPTPAPEPTPRRRRRLNRKWIIVGVLVTLVLGGGAYGANAKGNSNAEKYDNAVDAWNDQKNDLVGAPAAANSELWDFEDATLKKSLKKQKRACSDIRNYRKSAAKNAAALPTKSNSVFKYFSPAERKAIKSSKAREKAVKAYARAADKVLVQMHRDCAWNIKVNSAKEGDSGANKLVKRAEGLRLKVGQTEYYCPSSYEYDCLPTTAAKRAQYAELLIKAINVERKYVMKRYFSPGSCDSTSYGDLCVQLRKGFASFYGSLESIGSVFGDIDPTNAKLQTEVQRMLKSSKSADKAFKKALFKAHPDFKDNYMFMESAFWKEAFFDAATVEAITDINKLKKKLLDASVN